MKPGLNKSVTVLKCCRVAFSARFFNLSYGKFVTLNLKGAMKIKYVTFDAHHSPFIQNICKTQPDDLENFPSIYIEFYANLQPVV